MTNNGLSKKFSGNFKEPNINHGFLNGTRYSTVKINEELLQVMLNFATDSFQTAFNSYRDYDKFMVAMRRKYKYNLVISRTKLFTHYRKLYSEKKITTNYQL